MPSKSAKETVAKKNEDFNGLMQEYVSREIGYESNQRHKSVALNLAKEALFQDRFEKAASKIFKNKITPSGYALKKVSDKHDRVINLLLSDLHFHSLLDKREVPTPYGPVEESRRLAHICREVAEYKQHYRSHTALYVHILGDVIQGQLHDARDGAPLAEQVAAAMYLLSQAISFLSKHFPKVVVLCTPGNHGRNTSRHKDRAVHQKWDSIENMVYYGLKLATDSLKNVTVEISYKPYYIVDIFDKRALFTHGDTVLNPGFPNRSINVASLEKQINSFNAAEGHRQQKEISLFGVGHVHVGSITHLSGGATLVTNGCLVPSDPYAVSIGILETNCGQWIIESVPGFIAGDSRFISVNSLVDQDSKLDQIIKPFRGF